MELDVLIYGYGGHGRVLAELLNETMGYKIGVFDELIPNELPDYIKYLGSYNPNLYSNLKILIAVGNNLLRSKIVKTLNHDFHLFIHPSAYVSPTAKIGAGTVILQNAVVQSHANLGKHCIVNIGSLVDHDSQIGDFCHIAPSSYVGGGAQIPSFLDLFPGQIIPRQTVLNKPE